MSKRLVGLMAIVISLVACAFPTLALPPATLDRLGGGARVAVSFDLNYAGSADAPVAQNVRKGALVTKPAPDPARGGYEFSGWYREKECATAWVFAADAASSSCTLFAKWTTQSPLVTWTLSFDLNAAGATGAPAAQAVADGAKAAAPTGYPSRAGFSFQGWYREAACQTLWNFSADAVRDQSNIAYG